MFLHSRRRFYQLLWLGMSEDQLPENPEKEDYTQRRFRRYHKAQARRRRDAAADARFSGAVFSVAGVAAAIAIALGVLGLRGASVDPDAAQRLTDPWIGPVSRMDAYGIGLIAFLGLVYLWRIRRR